MFTELVSTMLYMKDVFEGASVHIMAATLRLQWKLSVGTPHDILTMTVCIKTFRTGTETSDSLYSSYLISSGYYLKVVLIFLSVGNED